MTGIKRKGVSKQMSTIYDVIVAGTKTEAQKAVNKKYPASKRAKVVYTKRKNKVGPGYFWIGEVYK